MDPAEIPHGVDPKTACRVEVTVSSYVHAHDGIKEYCKGRTIGWVVDSEEYAIIDMEKEIGKHYSWDETQEVNFWYDGVDGHTIRLATDAEFLGLMRASRKLKLIMTVDRCEHVLDDQNSDGQGLELAERPKYRLTVAGPPVPEFVSD